MMGTQLLIIQVRHVGECMLELVEQILHLKILPFCTRECGDNSHNCAIVSCFGLMVATFLSNGILVTWEMMILAILR